MEITNTKGLPEPFVQAISFNDFLPAGNLSAYRAQEPPQITRLKKLNKIEEDVSDKIWTLLSRTLVQVVENGVDSARHRRSFTNVIQMISDIANDELNEEVKAVLHETIGRLDKISAEYIPADDRYLLRQSFSIKVTTPFTIFKGTENEQNLSGTMYVFDTIPMYDTVDKILYYPRICNVFHAEKPEMRDTWVRESNVQAAILRANGFEVSAIKAIMLFKDWNQGRAEADIDGKTGYPQKQVEVISLPVNNPDKVNKFITARVAQHLRLEHGDIAKCSPSDRWETATEYAVVRPASTRLAKETVVKRTFTETEANTWLAKHRDRYTNGIVKKKPGRSKRCEGYCPVAQYCPQWKEIKANNYE